MEDDPVISADRPDCRAGRRVDSYGGLCAPARERYRVGRRQVGGECSSFPSLDYDETADPRAALHCAAACNLLVSQFDADRILTGWRCAPLQRRPVEVVHPGLIEHVAPGG